MIEKKYLIPNGLTLTSLIVGLIALQNVVLGNYIVVCWLVTLSMVLDLLDGKVARKLSAFSSFGAELDSLVDFLCFGVVPAFLAYNYILYQLGYIGVVIALFYVLTSAIRLAKFNAELSDSSKKADFTGLPITASAGIIVSYIIFANKFPHNMFLINLMIAFIFVSLMMISKVVFRPLKESGKHRVVGKVFLIVLLLLSTKYAAIIYFPTTIFLLIKNILNNIGLYYQHKSKKFN